MSNLYQITSKKSLDDPKLYLGLRFYALGETLKQAALRAGVSESKLSKFIKSSKGRDELSKIRTEVDEEFFNLQSKVNEVLRMGLESSDPQIALASANMWLRAAKAKEVNVNVTVEDVLQRLFNENVNN